MKPALVGKIGKTNKIDNIIWVLKNKYFIKNFKVKKLHKSNITYNEALIVYGKLVHVFTYNNIEIYHFKDKALGHSYCTKVSGVFGFPFNNIRDLLATLS